MCADFIDNWYSWCCVHLLNRLNYLYSEFTIIFKGSLGWIIQRILTSNTFHSAHKIIIWCCHHHSKKKKLYFQSLGLLDVDKDFNQINPHKETDDDTIGIAGLPLTHAGQYHALPGNGHPQALVQSVRVNPVVVPSKCLSNMIAVYQDITDMTGKMTPEGRHILVCNCVKTVLFRCLKFFNKDLHGIYDHRETTLCGLVIKSCNLSRDDATLEWWAIMRKIVIATHKDHQNNVIKAMRLHFRGTFQLWWIVRLFMVLPLLFRAPFTCTMPRHNNFLVGLAWRYWPLRVSVSDFATALYFSTSTYCAWLKQAHEVQRLLATRQGQAAERAVGRAWAQVDDLEQSQQRSRMCRCRRNGGSRVEPSSSSMCELSLVGCRRTEDRRARGVPAGTSALRGVGFWISWRAAGNSRRRWPTPLIIAVAASLPPKILFGITTLRLIW